MIISNPKYSFLKELGLDEENCGVFSGEWKSSGSVVDSVSPATNEIIARVQYGSLCLSK